MLSLLLAHRCTGFDYCQGALSSETTAVGHCQRSSKSPTNMHTNSSGSTWYTTHCFSWCFIFLTECRGMCFRQVSCHTSSGKIFHGAFSKERVRAAHCQSPDMTLFRKIGFLPLSLLIFQKQYSGTEVDMEDDRKRNSKVNSLVPLIYVSRQPSIWVSSWFAPLDNLDPSSSEACNYLLQHPCWRLYRTLFSMTYPSASRNTLESTFKWLQAP